MTTEQEIVNAIIRGEYDEYLNSIKNAIKGRQEMVSRAKFFTIKMGDRVRLVNLRPKYMVGATGTVLHHNNTRITVRLDQEWLARNPRSRWSNEVKVTPNMVEILS